MRVTVEALNAPPEQPVTDTRERLNRAVERLTERRDDPAIGRLERARLDGKVEGVKLALSYLNDVPRDCECHHRDFAAPHAPGCVYR